MRGLTLLSALFALLLAVATTACSDDEQTTGDGDTGGDAGGDTAPDTGGGDMLTDVTSEPDADPLPLRECGRPAAQDETVAYDAISPVGAFVTAADITLAEGVVTVDLLELDSEDFPDQFSGTFAEGTNCADAVFTGFDVDVCFFNPDGSAAAPESLGAQIFVYLDGSVTTEPEVDLVGGLRQGLDLSCSLAGFFELDVSGLTESGDLPEGVATAVEEALLGYVALYELGEGDIAGLMGTPPRVDPRVEADVLEGDVLLELDEIEVSVGEGAEAVDYFVDVTLDGAVDLDNDELTATLTVDISNTDESVTGQLSGSVSGTRN